jgi:flagellar basal body rod protein FlgC
MANYNYDFWSKEFEYKPGGAKSQQMIGQAIDSSIEERRLMADRAEAKKDRQLKRNILNYNYAQKMAQDMDDLNIMPTAGVQGMDQIMTAAGRSIADQAAYLNKELKRTGDMASYSSAMAKLKGEVSSIKNMDQEAKAFLGGVNTAIENGTFSDYNSPELLGMAEDMRRGSPKGRFENINGVTTWVSETVDGKPYQVAASQFSELSKKLQVKDDVDTLLKSSISLNQGRDGNILGFNQSPSGIGGQGLSAADLAADGLTDLINTAGPGNKERKSAALLVDHFGVPSRRAKELMAQVIDEDQLTPQEKADGIVTEGDRLLQNKWLQKAESMYGINQKAVSTERRARQDQYEQHKEKIDNRRDVDNTIANLPSATINNNNENDPLSKKYQFKNEANSNPGKFWNDVETSLIEKGFTSPKRVYSEAKTVYDPKDPNADENGVVTIPSRFMGYQIVNEKLPANRRTPVTVYAEDFNNLDDVYKKIYAATGMESFGRKPISAKTKTGTNDPITEMQGIGQSNLRSQFGY